MILLLSFTLSACFVCDLSTTLIIEYIYIYIYILKIFIWLHWVLLAACRIFYCHPKTLWLWCMGSLIVVYPLQSMWTLVTWTHRLSCFAVRGVLAPQPGAQTHVPCIARQILNHWTDGQLPWKAFLERFSSVLF